MANVYVRSAAAGAGTGADWANAYTTLAAAYAAKAAGDDFWMAGDHAETQASAMALTSPGTAATPCRVICVNHAGTVPPVAADLLTTATVTTTATNIMTMQGCAYFEGITFNSGTTGASGLVIGGASVANTDCYFKNCGLNCLSSATSNLSMGSATASVAVRVTWDNCTFTVGVASSGIALIAGRFHWKNTSGVSAIGGATIPTNLFVNSTSGNGVATLEGLDLSALSGKTLVVASLTKHGVYFFNDCKLPASITIAGTPTSSATEVYVFRTASGATAYTLEKRDLRGAQTTETTIIRTGGKVINAAGVAMKIVPTAVARWECPFVSTPITINNATTGSPVTVTVYGIWAGGAVPTNAEVWMEVGYFGSALTPVRSYIPGTKATVLTAASNQTTDTSTWGGSTTKFKLTATFTPQLTGEIYIVIKAASHTNSTYIDPLPVLS